MRYRHRVLLSLMLGVSAFSLLHLPYAGERNPSYTLTVRRLYSTQNQGFKQNQKHKSQFISSRKSIPSKKSGSGQVAGSNGDGSIKLIQATTLRPWILSTEPLSNNDTDKFSCSALPPTKPLPPHRLPVTSLSSMPGSGNTWMRILLSSLTGVTTGDMYVDMNFRNVPGFSNLQDDTAVVIKSHEPYFNTDFMELEYSHFKRCIVLVRHPMDMTIASFNFAAAHSHTKTPPIDKYLIDGQISSGWRKTMTGSLNKWLTFMKYFLTYTKKRVYVLFYENLKMQLREEMVKVNEFIGLPLRKRRLECLLSDDQSKTTQEKFLRRERIYPHLVVDTEMADEIQKTVDLFREMYQDKFNGTASASIPHYYSYESLLKVVGSHNNTNSYSI